MPFCDPLYCVLILIVMMNVDKLILQATVNSIYFKAICANCGYPPANKHNINIKQYVFCTEFESGKHAEPDIEPLNDFHF